MSPLSLAHLGLSREEIEDYSVRAVSECGISRGDVWRCISQWVGPEKVLARYLGYIMQGASTGLANSLCGLTKSDIERLRRAHEGFRYAYDVAVSWKDLGRIEVIEDAARRDRDWKAAAWLIQRDADTSGEYRKAEDEGLKIAASVPQTNIQNNYFDGGALRRAWERVEAEKNRVIDVGGSDE